MACASTGVTGTGDRAQQPWGQLQWLEPCVDLEPERLGGNSQGPPNQKMSQRLQETPERVIETLGDRAINGCKVCVYR